MGADARDLEARALLAHKEGRHDEALELCRGLLALDPTREMAWRLLGLTAH